MSSKRSGEKRGFVIMTDDKDGNPIEYTIEDIQNEMDNETEFGKNFKDSMNKVNERAKELQKSKKKKARLKFIDKILHLK